MTRATHGRNPEHPDFPHGTSNGRRYGCSCTRCRAADARACKTRRLRAHQGIKIRVGADDQAKVRAHVETLLEIPGATLHGINTAAGFSENVLWQFMTGRTKGIYRHTADALLALKPSDISVKFYPAEQAILLIGQLRALGYPIWWMEQQQGVWFHQIVRSRDNVEARTYNLLTELHTRIGDTPATPDVGLSRHQINCTKALAKRAGFYPPAFYDEDGTLDPRSIPDHPWGKFDDWCHGHIQTLDTILRNPGLGEAKLSRLVHPEGKAPDHLLARFRNVLGRLKLRDTHEGSEQRRADLADLLDAFDTDGGDPATFCLDNGLIDPGASEIPPDHPSIVDRADIAEAVKKAKRNHLDALRKATAASAAARAARVAAKQVGEAA